MDYYKILGIEATASPEQVKQAYRRKARQFHPDVNADPDASRQFRAVVEAYAVLSDPQKRSAYTFERREYIAKPSVNVWDRKFKRRQRYRTSLDFFHLALLLFGFSFVYNPVSAMAGALDFWLMAEPAMCQVTSWQVDNNGFQMRYFAEVPWDSAFEASAHFDKALDAEYPPGATFSCYYHERLSKTALQRLNLSWLGRSLPWLAFGSYLIFRAGFYFLREH